MDNKNPANAYPVAIKKVTNIFQKEILLKRAIRELKFMNFFQGHKNIVNLIDLEIINENSPYDGLYCYQELIDYDLAKVIHSSIKLTEFHIQYFMYQILSGLKYIHSADVIHRDLKPGNILCTLNGNLKICDFGLARGINPKFYNDNGNLASPKLHDITNYVATRWYRAPELILSHKMYTKAIDLWSVGCILAEFYGRRPIFMGHDTLHQVYEIVKILGPPSQRLLSQFASVKAYNIFNNNLAKLHWNSPIDWKTLYPEASNSSIHLLQNLLKWNPRERFDVEQAITHPFLNEVRTPMDEPVHMLGPFDFSYEFKLNSMEILRSYLKEEVKKFRQNRNYIYND